MISVNGLRSLFEEFSTKNVKKSTVKGIAIISLRNGAKLVAAEILRIGFSCTSAIALNIIINCLPLQLHIDS